MNYHVFFQQVLNAEEDVIMRLTRNTRSILLPLAALWLTLLCAATSQADTPKDVFSRENVKLFTVVAPEWPDYTNADGTGLYWQVLKAIYEPLDIRVKDTNVPWNRAMKMVTQYNMYNAIVGEYRDTEEDLLFPDYPIDVEYMWVLSKNPSLPEFNGRASLTGHRVGWIKDYEVIPIEDRDFELIEFRTTAQGLEYLNEGKIDYLIDEWDEIELALEETGFAEDDYDANEMPEGTDVYVAFANSELSKTLIEVYNERMKALLASGELAAIYQQWESDVPETALNAGK